MVRTLSPQRCYPNVQVPRVQNIEEHQITHFPFCSWCPHCVRSVALADPHRRTAEPPETERIAMVNIDYFFTGSQGLSSADPSTEQDTLPILGVYDHQTRVTFAHVCKHKGERKHVNPGARHRLGLAWGPENAAAKRHGTHQRGTEASSGSPIGGH